MIDYTAMAREYEQTENRLRGRAAQLRRELALLPPNEQRDRVRRRLAALQEEACDVALVRLELTRRQLEEEAAAAC